MKDDSDCYFQNVYEFVGAALMKWFDQNTTLAEIAADEIHGMDPTASDAVNVTDGALVTDAAVGDVACQIAVVAVVEIAVAAACPSDWSTHCHQLVGSSQQYVVECDVSVDSETLDSLRMTPSVVTVILVTVIPVEN